MAQQHKKGTILIVGAGIFGLSTARSLLTRAPYTETKIILIDRSPFPAADGSSIDSSRIVRADYADPAYAKLAQEAVDSWLRDPIGREDRFSQSGLLYVLGEDVSANSRAYVQASLANVTKQLGLSVGRREDGAQVTVLRSPEEVKAAAPFMDGDVGIEGYVNWTSGWTDAERAMRFLRSDVESDSRVDCCVAEIETLLFDYAATPAKILGVRTTSGEEICADLTVLATGAWTPKFLDLRGIASASGQPMAYITLSDAEQKRLEKNPVLIDEGSGCFIIPPRGNILKVARHSYGYTNPKTFPYPEQAKSSTNETIEVSLPWTKRDEPGLQIPLEAAEACRKFLAKTIPELAERPWTNTRICWYTDTPTADWLIDYHPKYEGLFVATGGSGHAFKFLPIIGDRIVDVLMRSDRDALGAELRGKWRWPEERFRSDHVWTDDWRGGVKGLVLSEELARGTA